MSAIEQSSVLPKPTSEGTRREASKHRRSLLEPVRRLVEAGHPFGSRPAEKSLRRPQEDPTIDTSSAL